MNSWLRRVVLFVCCFFALEYLMAQETIVVGQVLDKLSGEPVAYANIYFKNSKIGTASNDEGWFMLRTYEKHPKQLLISAIGYKTMRFKVEQGQYVGLQVELSEDNAILQEVVAMPGVNPAWDILEQVRIHAFDNNIRQHPELAYRMQEETDLFVSRISSRNMKRSFWKQFSKGMIVSEDSTLLLPIYSKKNESITSGKQERDTLSAVQLDGFLGKESMELLLAPFEEPVDFYKNNVPLFRHNFISPLASNGKAYYHYFLIDSLTTDKGKVYHIRFRPSTNGMLAFRGEMWIDSTTYGLQEIHVELPDHINLNYVKQLSIHQQFSAQTQTPFIPISMRTSALMDYAIVLDTISSSFPTLLYERRQVHINHTDTVSALYTQSPTVRQRVGEEQMRAAMDSLYHAPLVRFARWVAEPFLTNYLSLGYVDLGRMSDIIAFNPIETMRLGIPFRTSDWLCPYFSVGGYGIYGFKDKVWKYGAYLQAKLPVQKLHQMKIGIVDDFTWTDFNYFDLFKRENASGYGYQDFTTSIMFAFEPALNYERKQELYLQLQDEWSDNFETRLSYYGGYRHYGDPLQNYYSTPFYTYHSVVLSGRLSFDERVYDAYFQRFYIHNYKPVITLGLEGGAYKMQTGSYQHYGKLHLAVRQRVPLGIAGELSYLAEGGCIFGAVPYPMLEVMQGNPTWAFDQYRFTLMDNLEFAADRYVTLHAFWNMQGLLFNRIPWVNRLNLREIVSCKIAYGFLSQKHNEILVLPTTIKAPSVPYLEVGVGIANILRVCTVQSVWRITNRSHSEAPLWGVRFSFDLGM